MAHCYPLAPGALEAFDPDAPLARTRAEAERDADGRAVEALETRWLELAPAGLDEAAVARAVTEGFAQRYENLDGTPVLAVTYWQLGGALAGDAALAPAAPARESPDAEAEAGDGAEGDHTDDLYFRNGRTLPADAPDQQLDLF